MAVPDVVAPQTGQVDVAVGEVGGRGHGGEDARVLLADGSLDVVARLPAEGRPQRGGHAPRLLEAAGRAQRDELRRPLLAEHLAEDALRGVVVVDEEDQIAEADEHVGALSRAGEGVRAPVDVTDDMDPHDGHRSTRAIPDLALGRQETTHARSPARAGRAAGRP